jgi:hypothetical protein
MTDFLYRQTLEAAKAEFDSLLEEEGKLENRLAVIRERTDVLRKTIISVGDLLGEDREPESVGITDAIRAVLKGRSDALFSAKGIRMSLQNANFPLANYKNVLAVIHTTLKRLEEQEEIAPVIRENKTYYKWIEKDEDIPF